jgi:hypothetical protein
MNICNIKVIGQSFISRYCFIRRSHRIIVYNIKINRNLSSKFELQDERSDTMKNTGLMIINHNVPCCCACHHCFFESKKQAEGVQYERGEKITQKFQEWREERQLVDFSIFYAISHIADFPQLSENISLNRKLDASYKFLQINGIKLRDEIQLKEYIQNIKSAGITDVDPTFYGLEDFHDNFAGRIGDYRYLFDIISCLKSFNLNIIPTFVMLETNKDQLNELVSEIRHHVGDEQRLYGFLPNYRGRGKALENDRLLKSSFEALPKQVQGYFNISRHKTEAEWIEAGFMKITKRYLHLALRPDNIDMLESMSCDEILDYLIKTDETYYTKIPSIEELAHIYGDSHNERLYEPRDLPWKWQRQYIQDHKLNIPDISDQRICGSIRS